MFIIGLWRIDWVVIVFFIGNGFICIYGVDLCKLRLFGRYLRREKYGVEIDVEFVKFLFFIWRKYWLGIYFVLGLVLSIGYRKMIVVK